MRPSLRQAAATSMCTTPGATACSAPSGADSSLVGGPQKKKLAEKNKDFTHITCFAGQYSANVYSWTLLRPCSMPDACTNTNHAQFERCETTHARKHDTHTCLRTKWSPNVVRHHLALRTKPLQPPLRCRLRQAQRGRDLLVAHASGCLLFRWQRVTVRTGPPWWRRCLQTPVLSRAWVSCLCQMCKNLLFYDTFSCGWCFSPRGAQDRHEHVLCWASFLHTTIPRDNCILYIRRPDTLGNKEPKTQRVQS